MGTDPTELLAELLGRASGVNGGLAGSMNVVDPDHGVMGCYGIVGGSMAAATGAALALRGTGHVAVAYFGDGTANHGYFFECLNFAKVFALPVVFVCENNRYGEYTPTEAVTPGGILPGRPRSRFPRRQSTAWTSGRSRVAAEVVEQARGGSGPQFVEAATYRFVGHSRSDPGKYRPEGELDRWKQRDPLAVAASGSRRVGSGRRTSLRSGTRSSEPSTESSRQPSTRLPRAVRPTRVRNGGRVVSATRPLAPLGENLRRTRLDRGLSLRALAGGSTSRRASSRRSRRDGSSRPCGRSMPS